MMVKDPTAGPRVRPRHLVPAREFDSPQQEAYLNLWRTYDRLKAFEDEVFTAFDLSAQQYNALRLLRDVAPQTLPTLSLAARLISRAPDITRLVDRLEARGLVCRERQNHNRRVVQVGLTPSGEALLDAMADRVLECGARQLGHLTAEQLQSLVGLLKIARLPHESSVADPATTATPLKKVVVIPQPL